MATTYTASFEFECWKQHTCVGCNESFQYVLKRKVQGQGGTEQAAFGAAQQAAVKAMNDDVDVHPCPKCGTVQPDMVAAVQRPWYWWAMLTAIGGVMVAFFPVLAHGWKIETSAMIAVVPMGIGLLLALVGSLRNPNADVTSNVNRVQRQLDQGKLRIVPNAEGASDVDQEFDDVVPSSYSSSNTLALAMFAVGLLAVLAAPLVRMSAGWPLNERWYPAVVGPGDESTFYYREKLSSMKGYWHAIELPGGQTTCGALLENAGDLGVDVEDGTFSGTTKASTWGDTINSKSTTDPSNRMWAKIAFPQLDALAEKEAQLTIMTEVLYPATINRQQGEVRQKFFTEKNVAVQLAAAGAGGNYHQIWMMGQIAAMVLALFGGITLLRAASGLVAAAHPIAIFPIEDPDESPGAGGTDDDPFGDL